MMNKMGNHPTLRALEQPGSLILKGDAKNRRPFIDEMNDLASHF
ncbi:MAG: hypothetical protein QHH06_01960 [Clostridiales bacterium]|jgi:hypothetical protein|nr:hypothetical protein [Eubacteriales bacterium]MDH7565236.1 hypothetical protein [Clostridiales bacterium]